MSYRAKCVALAKKNNITLNEQHSEVEWEVTSEAPEGYIFAGHDVHGLVCCVDRDEKKEVLWREVFEDMKDGLTPCPDYPKCDVCGEFDE